MNGPQEATKGSARPVAVAYAAAGQMAEQFQRARKTALPLSAVVARLRAGIVAADLWVLHEIDPQALLSRGGYAIRAARQIFFFHPRLMARLLEADPAALLEAPLKFAVLELADNTVEVRWFEPLGAFARYGNAALEAFGKELAVLCEEIAMRTLEPESSADAHV